MWGTDETKVFTNIEEVRRAECKFVEDYNAEWPVERNGFVSPRQARLSLDCGPNQICLVNNNLVAGEPGALQDQHRGIMTREGRFTSYCYPILWNGFM